MLLEFGVSFLNLEWKLRIRSELYESGVSFQNLECVLEFGVHLLATVHILFNLFLGAKVAIAL